MTRTHRIVAVLALVLLPAALHAGQPARGEVVAVAEDFLVLDADHRQAADGVRRLFVLDGTDLPADLRVGERATVRFTVGDDNELHAFAVERETDVEIPERQAPRHRLVALLAMAALGPQGLALSSLLGP